MPKSHGGAAEPWPGSRYRRRPRVACANVSAVNSDALSLAGARLLSQDSIAREWRR